MAIVLFLLAVVAFLGGCWFFTIAQSAIHEIAALMSLLISAVFLTGAALREGLDRLVPRAQPTLPAVAPSLAEQIQGSAVRAPSVEFVDDDPGYLAWLQQYPDGWVLNIYRGNNQSDMALHKATCSTIRPEGAACQPGDFTGKQYMKVCAADIERLQSWARQQGRRERVFSATTCGCPRA